MQSAIPLACFLSMIRPPGIQFENSLLQIAPVDKAKCPFVRDNNDIGFWLYTRHNPTVYQELVIGDDEKLFASNMDYHAPTVIYFHAFMENPEDGSAVVVREAYMLRGDTNVIMVDASRLEAGPWYFTAAENTWYIGKFAAKFIDYLVSRGLDLSKTHLIGHSLGAQSAGVAGASLNSGRVSRITGLDPALPLFAGLPEEQRLDKTDADFVDVIHTDAGIFGVNQPVGHADFYPNGGISPQPGCELEVVIPQKLLLNKFFCSHWRSYMFYAESVLRPESFKASSCASWKHYTKGGCAQAKTAHMGFSVDNKAHGRPASWLTLRLKLSAVLLGENTTTASTQGFYTYHLTPNKKNKSTQTLENNILKLFNFIRSVKYGIKMHKTTETGNTDDVIGSKYTEFEGKSLPNKKVINSPEIATPVTENVKEEPEENPIKIDSVKSKDYSLEDQIMVESVLKPYYHMDWITNANNNKLKQSFGQTYSTLQSNKRTEQQFTQTTEEPDNRHEEQFTQTQVEQQNKEQTTKELISHKKQLTPQTEEPNNRHEQQFNRTQFEQQYSNEQTTEELISHEKQFMPRIDFQQNSQNVLPDQQFQQTTEAQDIVNEQQNHELNYKLEQFKQTTEEQDERDKERNETKDNSNKKPTQNVTKRQKRFINPFKRSEAEESENFLFKMLNFLLKNRKSIVPVYSVMREINTLVKSGNGELNHVTKERNNFIGGAAPALNPVTYTLELGNESKTLAFIKRLLGMTPKGDRLTINGNGK